jgi:acyl-CoA synthetase (AMP-forming)/AMP-acid ligase II
VTPVGGGDDDPRRLISALRHWARTAEDHPFLTFRDLDGVQERHTYGAFYDRVRRLAGGLLESGLRPGDRCIVHTGNTPGFMLAFWALQAAGAVPIPTIVQYSEDELGYVVRHSGAWGVITTQELATTARAALDGLDCRLIVEESAGEDVMSLQELTANGRPGPERGSADDLALIMYTSGTTARPKGVMLGQQGALYTAASYAQHLRLTPADTVLTCMPLFHVNGMFLQMAPAVLSGSQFVLTPRFSASRYWEWVAEHEATMTHLISGPIRLLLAADPAAGDRRDEVRGMTFGLPLLADEIEDFQERFRIPLMMVWGLTETGCGGTLMPLGHAARPGHQHIGPPMIGWEVQAVDPGLRALEAGEVGELVVRSPGVMHGYYNDPDATAATLQDGWVRTGDLGFRDDHGYFHFVDRMKDMLKPSGENVAASEIEGVIEEHPCVAECAVIGIPDPIRTELVIALVVPRDGTSVSADEIKACCSERLARFKVPSIVEFRDELPKTSIGKIRKGELRQELSERGPAL